MAWVNQEQGVGMIFFDGPYYTIKASLLDDPTADVRALCAAARHGQAEYEREQEQANAEAEVRYRQERRAARTARQSS